MTDAANPLRVLIVGAGRRVQSNFLPALACLPAHFTVQAIVAPTSERRDPLATQWKVAGLAAIGDVDLATIDVVAISVPTSQNASVLQALLPHAHRLRLVIDTPIAWNRREYTQCAAFLGRFKQVTVAEDYMNFPSFALARQAVASGLIGEPQWLTLNNIGFFYHGLALIRSFADFEKVRSSKRVAIGDQVFTVVYTVGGLKASVIGPYRGHSAGGLVVKGSAGTITQFPKDIGSSGMLVGPQFLLAPIFEKDVVSGYAIEAGERSMSLAIPEFGMMSAMDLPDKSALNLERGCGLISVFRSLIEPDGLNSRYTVDDAFYDRFVSWLATRGRLPVDPFRHFGSSVMGAYKQLAKLGG